MIPLLLSLLWTGPLLAADTCPSETELLEGRALLRSASLDVRGMLGAECFEVDGLARQGPSDNAGKQEHFTEHSRTEIPSIRSHGRQDTRQGPPRYGWTLMVESECPCPPEKPQQATPTTRSEPAPAPAL